MAGGAAHCGPSIKARRGDCRAWTLLVLKAWRRFRLVLAQGYLHCHFLVTSNLTVRCIAVSKLNLRLESEIKLAWLPRAGRLFARVCSACQD